MQHTEMKNANIRKHKMDVGDLSENTKEIVSITNKVLHTLSNISNVITIKSKV